MSLKPHYLLLFAFCLALLLHTLFLSRTWLPSSDSSTAIEKPLSVLLIKDTEEPDLKPESQEEVIEPIEERPAPEKNIEEHLVNTPKEELEPTVEIIVDQASSEDKESKIEVTQIQTSLNSRSFSRFIESETKNYAEEAPESVSKFDKTFAPQQYYKSPEELNPLSPKYTKPTRTDYAIERNGKRTCLLRIVNMLDITKGDSFVAQDCTPEKKFELDLNKPQNGWTKR